MSNEAAEQRSGEAAEQRSKQRQKRPKGKDAFAARPLDRFAARRACPAQGQMIRTTRYQNNFQRPEQPS
jgi:hypothetical protein